MKVWQEVVKPFTTLMTKLIFPFKDNSLDSGNDVTFGLARASLHYFIQSHLLPPTATFRYFLPIYLFPNMPSTTSGLSLLFSKDILSSHSQVNTSPVFTGRFAPKYWVEWLKIDWDSRAGGKSYRSPVSLEEYTIMIMQDNEINVWKHISCSIIPNLLRKHPNLLKESLLGSKSLQASNDLMGILPILEMYTDGKKSLEREQDSLMNVSLTVGGSFQNNLHIWLNDQALLLSKQQHKHNFGGPASHFFPTPPTL